MALPEPIPTIKKTDVPEFDERWRKHKLSKKQKELYKDAKKAYEKNPF